MSACLPCQEQEHDTCHNLLWDAGCGCTHADWPEPRCQVRGRDKGDRPGRYLCDLPRYHAGAHEGRHWVVPSAAPDAAPWGWRPEAMRWRWRRAFAPPGRFDPWDPTAPGSDDQAGQVA